MGKDASSNTAKRPQRAASNTGVLPLEAGYSNAVKSPGVAVKVNHLKKVKKN